MNKLRDLLRRSDRSEPAPAASSATATATAPPPVELPPAQAEILAELRERGIVIVPFERLMGGDALWTELAGDIDGFATEAAANAPSGDSGPAAKDDYLIRRWGHLKKERITNPTPTLAPDSPWLRYALSDALLGVITAYRGGDVRLVDFDHWYTVPFGGGHERMASQRWHRDPEDQHVVKVFTYFSDVDSEAGPFQYVPGSAEGGRYGEFYPWGKSKWYPPQEEIADEIPESEHFTAEGPRGTVVICDTSGFHRGGFARTKPRVLSYFTFVSPQADMARRFGVEGADAGLSAAARAALA